jgi:hypothetical protein
VQDKELYQQILGLVSPWTAASVVPVRSSVSEWKRGFLRIAS